MQEMKKWQPKLRQLQEKYKNDRQKLNEEIMKFYSEHKINPFGGCLPILLQIPIFIALFQVLNTNPDLEGKPFLFLIRNLSLAPSAVNLNKLGIIMAVSYYALIALMILTTYIQQKMMSADPQQDRIMLFMSVIMAVIAWNLPAGVLLYWITTNIWGIVQQYVSIEISSEGKGA